VKCDGARVGGAVVAVGYVTTLVFWAVAVGVLAAVPVAVAVGSSVGVPVAVGVTVEDGTAVCGAGDGVELGTCVIVAVGGETVAEGVGVAVAGSGLDAVAVGVGVLGVGSGRQLVTVSQQASVTKTIDSSANSHL